MTVDRKLGIWMCAALVVGNMIGAGIFLLPASLAPFGMNSVIAWVATSAACAAATSVAETPPSMVCASMKSAIACSSRARPGAIRRARCAMASPGRVTECVTADLPWAGALRRG